MRATFSAAVVLTAGLALFACRSMPEQDSPETPRPAVATEYPITIVTPDNEEGHRLEAIVKRMRQFEQTLRGMESQLLEGTVTLEEAGDRVLESAKADNQPFLLWMQNSDPQLPLQVKAIRVLMNRIAIAEQDGLLTSQQKEQAECLRSQCEATLAAK